MTKVSVGGRPARCQRVKSGSATLVEPGTRICVRQAEPLEFLAISMDPGRVRQLGEQWAGDRPWRLATITDLADPGVAAIAHELRRSMLTDHLGLAVYLQSLADALVTRLLCAALGELGDARSAELLSPAKLARVLKHIDEHLDGLVRVEALAQIAGLSRWHFSRVFQATTGDTPQRYVLKRRVCRARDLLTDHAASLVEVALRSGFSSQAHMTTVFRQEVGTTPGRYRTALFGEDG